MQSIYYTFIATNGADETQITDGTNFEFRATRHVIKGGLSSIAG